MGTSTFPEIISAAATLVAAIALLVIAIRGFRRLEAKVGGVHLVAEQVNAAVNNVGQDQPTLRNVVVSIGDRLDLHIEDSTRRFDAVEHRLTAQITESNQRFDRIEEFITNPRKDDE